MTIENQYYKTTNISLCASLYCFGYHIESIDKTNPSKAVFLIRKDKKLDDLIQSYFTHELSVEPLSYFNFLKEIKTRLYNS
jgi:hypothetical protein